MTFAAPYPYNLAGRPAKPAEPAPAPAPCVGCQNKAGEIAYKADRVKTLEREKAELLERITELQALANAAQPAPADFAELRARTHLLADQEAKARAALADKTNELQTALGKLASAERTIANLHTRFERLGMTP